MESREIRQKFLNYFKQQGHEIVPSSPLIPANDPTLLFTNAGMVQFKDVFLGQDKRAYSRAASVQRCVRAGGKHNDLENVGHTKRHHTFFEMLGNFSFADYFKREAIAFAWQFLTEILQLPPERLWITVFQDDQESENIWLNEIKVNQERFSRCGESDNFWSMGDVGPCGPCTEIFYDHGSSIAGGPPGSQDQDGDRYVEIWNLVFMQYNRDVAGKLHDLPRPCVDTGMGLERITAVMQGVHDNYDTDLFLPLLTAIAKIVHCEDFSSPSMRVIADHIRSAAFLIAEGVVPANEGRGYVLRRIIRRAIRHGYKLDQRDPFFYRIVEPLCQLMGDTYPELIRTAVMIQQIIEQEEIQFSHTLENGMKIFELATATLSGTLIPGKIVFQLYDTFGFPVDLTADMAAEKGLTLDYDGFTTAMEQQREQSLQAHQLKTKETSHLEIFCETKFTGYDNWEDDGKVVLLFKGGQAVTQLNTDDSGIVVLDKTPFYAESGGQVGDTGLITFPSGYFQVTDTQKQGRAYLHHGKIVAGQLSIGDEVYSKVDESRRDIMLNHTATHLLHEALRQILGEHVVQRGSLVAADRLRFDFSHAKPLTSQQIQEIENLINYQIRANQPSSVEETSLAEAKQSGALALFGEKYGERVRVISMGDFSTEVCGGTHAASSGEIGLFKIISETASASGIRRIEAVTGQRAIDWIQSTEDKLQTLMDILKANREDVTDKLQQLMQSQRELQKQNEQLKQQLALQQTAMLADQAIMVADIPVLVAQLDADRETLRHIIDQLKQQLGKAVIVLASVMNQKVQLVVSVNKDFFSYFTAPQLLKHISGPIAGRGGGRDDLAQGGGERPEGLKTALDSVAAWVKAQIKNLSS